MANEFKAKNGLLAPYAGVVYVDLDTNTTATPARARLWYNTDEDTLNIGHDNGVVQQVGQEFFMPPCKNTSGVTIPNGSFVMSTGVQGDKITIAAAVTNGTVDPQHMIGVATRDITTADEFAQIVTNGVVRDLNTSAWTVGTILYPNPEVAGGWTSTKPAAPAIKTPIAIVLRQHANTGRIYVRMTNGSVLGGTDSNVEFGTLSNNDLIVYNATAGRWENKQPSGITGLSGYSGQSGYSGYSGYSGQVGSQGEPGTSGFSGYSGQSGYSGYSGQAGETGLSGYSGYSGTPSLNYTYAASPPLSPIDGDIWTDSNTGIQYIYINDGDSTQWVEVGLSVAEGITPGGTTGQILAKASNANYDTQWVTPDSFSGYSGYSGFSGYSGQNGSMGVDGTSGYSGFSGYSGQNGSIGINGASGFSGYSGWSGISGFSGAAGSVAAPTDDTSTNSSYYPLIVTAVGSTTTKTSSTKLYFNPSTGTLNATVFNSLSDEKYKTDIQPINNAIDITQKLNGVSFKWSDNGIKTYGLIAQDVERVIPEIVATNESGDKSINYSAIIAFLVESNKQLINRVNELEQLIK